MTPVSSLKALLRHFYRSLPFKREFFALTKRFVVPGERVFKHLHFKGTFPVRIDESHVFLLRHHGFQIENEIFWRGLRDGWEPTSMGLWLQLCRRAQVIFDVGANTGIYALAAKCLNPAARVYAFEPVRRVYERLVENNTLNHFNLVCMNHAVSNRDGAAVIYDTATEHVLSVTVGKNLNSPDVEVIPTTVQAVRLDTVIRHGNLDRLDLMKVDVETHEAEVLEGLGDYLGRYRPALLIEVLNDDVGERVQRLVRDLGYLFFNIDDTRRSVRRVDRVAKSDHFNYLLCEPLAAEKLGLT